MAGQIDDSTETETSFMIIPSGRDDIPRLSRIHVDACAEDNAISLYFMDGDQFYNGLVSILEGQVGDRAWTHINAVDTATGTVAAWASWVEVTVGADEEPVNFKFQPGLGTLGWEDTDRFFKARAKGQQHYWLKALFTDKPFRRCGIGNALIRYSNEVADRTKTPIILQASSFGYPIYVANGYMRTAETQSTRSILT